MLVLHAGIDNGQLWIWGETPAGGEAAPVKRRGRKSKTSGRPPLPYDAGTARLSAALSEALPSLVLGESEVVTLWLPTANGIPVASSPLIAEPPEDGAAAVLAPWTVMAVPLSPEQAVEVLCACIGKETLATGVIVGKTLAFWATVLRLAGSLVAREQFLPGVDDRQATVRARWQPILAGADTQRLTQLAQTMPPACRALRREGDVPPDASPTALLNAFLETLLDALVRSAVGPASVPALPGRHGRKAIPSFASLHDQWLYALRSRDGIMAIAAADQAKFVEQLREWQRPITVSVASPFRLCFRLEEPPDTGGGESLPVTSDAWYVRYFLQAADDPSLLIPVGEVWTAKGRKAALLQRNNFHPREYLFAALGQAAGICAEVEQSLKTATPAGYQLDVQGAHAFLTEKAWLLEQAGFGLLLPAWWTRKGTKQRLTARANVKNPTMQGGGGLSLMDLIQFDWQVALGGQPLSLQELEMLARLKAPLVKVRGQWVQLSAEEIQAALGFWKKQGAGQATLREIVQMALGAAEAPGGIAFEGVTATGWIDEFLAQLQGRSAFEEFAPPAGFRGTLRPYQVRGYSWLGFLGRWGLGACLADDMGLGKTVQTLALIQHLWETQGHRPTLLICPMSVVGNWQKEADRFTPELPVLVHHGGQRRKGSSFPQEAHQRALVLSSYALLHRDFELLKEVPWAGVVLDEAQNIKNPQTKQAQAARSLPADFHIALTGTPVENHIGDLWSIMEFLNPGFLGTQAEFKRTFFVPIQANRDPEATQRLKRLTGPFLLRRLKTDKTIIADLPDKLEMKVFCTLTKEQASLYAAVVEDSFKSLRKADEGIQRKGVILAALSKLKQVCNHPAQFLGDNSPIPDRSGKLARLTEMLEEVLETGDRALVFTQFQEMGALLKRHLEETFGREVLFLHGAVTKKHRDRMVERFQAETEGPRIFVLSLKAGGTGLNLTNANHVFHFDRWWNPAVENQATDRAFRIGQTRNVQVHKYLCVGTLEEKIDEMIERKQEVAAKVVGTGEGWLTELSNDQLKDLFALRKEALGI
jgi:SNF2 family DNA or RNA helicase